MSHEQVRDTSWLRSSFFFLGQQHDDRHRYQKGKGWTKFMDTTLGGNSAINAPYQFTRYADIKEKRLLPHVGKGMGRWYSENIDDWGHNVHFRMGVPAYTGILPFAMKAINGSAARYVATGRTPGWFSKLGRGLAFIASAIYWEITLITSFVDLILEFTHSRYYYLKPTMYQYWRVVQTILNTLSANLGITMTPEQNKVDKDREVNSYGSGGGGTSGDLKLLQDSRKALPGTFRTPALTGFGQDIGVDVHAVASRAQALQVQFQEELTPLLERIGSNIPPKQVGQMIEDYIVNQSVLAKRNVGHLSPVMTNTTLSAYEKSFTELSWYSESVEEATRGKDLNEALNQMAVKARDDASKNESGFSKWFKESVDSFTNYLTKDGPSLGQKLLAEFRDGSQWTSFRVNNAVESVTESFSNSSAKSDIANLFNTISQAFRGASFNLGGGNTGIGPLDSIIQGVGGALMDGIADGASTLTSFTNPILGALYGAQIEIPKRWDSSQTQFTTTTFTMELRAGYGNVISYYQDILFPIAMVLAMALPRGTGTQSYGSPFYVQYYSKGRSQVRLGLISSLQITRGKGNSPWHKRGWPMGVDISMTVEDMSEVMFTPVAQNIGITTMGKEIFGSPIDENAMGDYMAVLSALGMNEQEYFIPKLKRRYNNLINNFDKWLSPDRWIAITAHESPFSFLSAFADQTSVRN